MHQLYKRLFDIENQLDEAMFLFGGRQVGKSTLLKERFPGAIYYDLLKSDLRRRLRRNPELFRNALLNEPEGTLVVVNEIQKVPDLLDEVHYLLFEKLDPHSVRNLGRRWRAFKLSARRDIFACGGLDLSAQ